MLHNQHVLQASTAARGYCRHLSLLGLQYDEQHRIRDGSIIWRSADTCYAALSEAVSLRYMHPSNHSTVVALFMSEVHRLHIGSAPSNTPVPEGRNFTSLLSTI